MIGETSGSGQLRASSFIQPTFKQFVGQSGMPLTKARKDFITGKLVQMCAQDCRPMSIVEGQVSQSSVLHLILSTKFQ